MKTAAEKRGLAGRRLANPRPNNQSFRYLLLAVLLSSLLGCQATSRPEQQSQPPPSAPVAATNAASMAAPPISTPQAAQTGLIGQLGAESDVSSQPDTALSNQMVLAIPVAKAAEILGGGSHPLTDKELRFLKAPLPQADPAITIGLTDAAGNYSLSLTPGEYILCVADPENTPPSFPATTRGCGRTSVPPGNLRRVDISSGFGEIVLIERPI